MNDRTPTFRVDPLHFTGAGLDALSQREHDILVLVTNGFSNAQISQQLFVSLNTVKTHIRACYRKIGAETRSHAVIWGVRHGLLVDADLAAEPGAPLVLGADPHRPDGCGAARAVETSRVASEGG